MSRQLADQSSGKCFGHLDLTARYGPQQLRPTVQWIRFLVWRCWLHPRKNKNWTNTFLLQSVKFRPFIWALQSAAVSVPLRHLSSGDMFHQFLNSALDVGEWSASRPKEHLIPSGQESGRTPQPVWILCWREKSNLGRPARRCIGWAIPTTNIGCLIYWQELHPDDHFNSSTETCHDVWINGSSYIKVDTTQSTVLITFT
jgi:hypothetical protein